MVNIKKSSYILLLLEDNDGKIFLLKLRRNFTYQFDAIIFGSQIDICYLYNVLEYLTEDELRLILYLYESTKHNEPEDMVSLSNIFHNLYSYCGNNIDKFTIQLSKLKLEFKTVIDISSHPNAVNVLIDAITERLGSKTNENKTKPLVYPGGRSRKDDKNLLETAIRETFEETRIRKEGFRILKTKPFFRETYTSSDGMRYAQMFFLAKLDTHDIKSLEIELEGVFNEVVIVPIPMLNDDDLLENTIKNIDLVILKQVLPKDARSYVSEVLTSKRFLETDVFKNYNTGKTIKDYKLSFIKYLTMDLC